MDVLPATERALSVGVQGLRFSVAAHLGGRQRPVEKSAVAQDQRVVHLLPCRQLRRHVPKGVDVVLESRRALRGDARRCKHAAGQRGQPPWQVCTVLLELLLIASCVAGQRMTFVTQQSMGPAAALCRRKVHLDT